MTTTSSRAPSPSSSTSTACASRSASRPPLALETPVQFVPGVGPQRAELLGKLGLVTAGGLLAHLPFRYEYEHSERPIGEIRADTVVTARGEVGATRIVGRGRSARFEANLIDPTGRLHLTWFGGGYLRQRIHPGTMLRVQGKTKRFSEYLQMVNPKWEVISPNASASEDAAPRSERYKPVYPATEDFSSDQIGRIIEPVLDELTSLINDFLPEEYLKRRALMPRAQAVRTLHAPQDEDHVLRARRRLAFDELFLLQLGVAMKRAQLRQHSTAPALNTSEAIDRHIIERFPFPLTPSQREVIEEIRADLGRNIPMNRLLQGDVGSGKTIVALYAALTAIASNRQAALLAPTEILAEQHHATVTEMLAGSRVRVELLTGTLPQEDKGRIRRGMIAGDIDFVIGTHALLAETVAFRSLAVVVIDEQHRFGVQQRAFLRQQASTGEVVPHVLVMTATPIPRTMSLTLFGDLDISIIRGLPPGRSPITTRVVGQDRAATVYEYIARRMREKAEQAYIVVPAIDENPDTGLKAVRSHMKHLEEGPLAGLHLAALHGQLKRDTRERIMYRFRRHEIDALVATTVIEVGLDVPNATLMVVEHAERFGLSQLHQLRGRVGRGSKRSLCTFITEPTTPEARDRLAAVAATNDGFVIAEKDFEIRGMGDIFGTRQAGEAPFRLAELPRDMELLNLARRDARDWIERDPTLAGEAHRAVRMELMKQYGSGLGIADVG